MYANNEGNLVPVRHRTTFATASHAPVPAISVRESAVSTSSLPGRRRRNKGNRAEQNEPFVVIPSLAQPQSGTHEGREDGKP
jgi:hypothetical protein